MSGEVERPAFETPPPATNPDPLAGYARRPRTALDLRLVVGADLEVLGDRTTCTVTLFQHSAPVWRQAIPGCAKGLEVALRLDSVVVARVEHLLIAWHPDGREAWRVMFEGDQVPRGLAPMAVLPDSHVVVAITPTTIVNVSVEGTESWRYSLPDDDPLVAPPEARRSEGLMLFTRSGASFLHSDGTLNGRATGGPT